MLGALILGNVAFAGEARNESVVKCQSKDVLKIEGTVTDGVLRAKVTLKVGNTVVIDGASVNYKWEDPESDFFVLIKDEAAESVKLGNDYFVPMTFAGSAKAGRIVFLLPISDEQGKPQSLLISGPWSCE